MLKDELQEEIDMLQDQLEIEQEMLQHAYTRIKDLEEENKKLRDELRTILTTGMPNPYCF